MKKTILILGLIIFALNVICQERINTPKPIISDNTTSKLNTAKGWRFMNNGEWFSLDNYIANDDVSLSMRDLLKQEKDSRSSVDNFSEFQFRDITYNGKDYTILIKKAYNGIYKYDAIKKDWIGFHKYSYVILDKEILKNKLDSIEDSVVNKIELPIISVPGYILDFGNKNNIIKEIESNIIIEDKKFEEEKNSREKTNDIIRKSAESRGRTVDEAMIQKNPTFKLILHLYPFKEKNIIQFVIYGYKYAPNTKIKFPFFLETNPVLDSDSASFFGTNKMFEHCYYETDYTTFDKFIKLP